jgi:hypothetical protein
MKITWHDSAREPQCAPNPAYPDGVDLDASDGAKTSCKAVLPYPAKRCGYFLVICEACGVSAAITTAGRRDDPRSVKLPCKLADAERGRAAGGRG